MNFSFRYKTSFLCAPIVRGFTGGHLLRSRSLEIIFASFRAFFCNRDLDYILKISFKVPDTNDKESIV